MRSVIEDIEWESRGIWEWMISGEIGKGERSMKGRGEGEISIEG